MENMTGKVWILGDDIDTDIIIPTEYLAMKTIDDMKQYAFSPLRPELAGQIQKGDIIVAGKNFGCGSSREQAPEIIKALGIQCVIAKSFARIFFRNSIYIGLPILENSLIADESDKGDKISVDLQNGIVKNLTKNKEYKCEKFPAEIQELIAQGGLINYTKKKMGVK